MCEKSVKIYKGLFPNFGLAWCPPNKNHLPTPMGTRIHIIRFTCLQRLTVKGQALESE